MQKCEKNYFTKILHKNAQSASIIYACQQIIKLLMLFFYFNSSIFRFINGRRRILQPMLDTPNTAESKAKKNKGISRSAQRFWPENIANLQTHTSATEEGHSQSDMSSNDVITTFV